MMAFRFTFGTIGDTAELNHTMDFILKQELAYPKYDKWVDKTRNEIELGIKTALIALSEGRIVGDLIFQSHKTLKGAVEIKN
ncbi:hypothetical protein MEO41_28775, partial [Dolichospermum sp. ST_sed4]|nr:hypothetical protein [Dolichospermum sp. ST_sed4]